MAVDVIRCTGCRRLSPIGRCMAACCFCGHLRFEGTGRITRGEEVMFSIRDLFGRYDRETTLPSL